MTNAVTKRRWVSVPVVVLAVSACSTPHGPMGHHGAHGDYCAEYRQTMEGKSPAERRAAAEAHIVKMHGSADAAHIDRHLRMMEQRCGGKAAAQ